jgi:large subunit ribosomal protein L14e
LALINYGALTNKVAVIIDIIDQSRALIDGPEIQRQSIPFRNLSLTAIKVDLPRGARPATIKQAFEKQEILAKFAKTSWSKKIEKQQLRAKLTDFDRFKLMLLKQKKSKIIGQEYAKVRAAAKGKKVKAKAAKKA